MVPLWRFGLRLTSLMFLKKPPLKYDQDDHARGDGRVSDVEYGAEEDEGISPFERYPVGIGAIYDGKIEHVDHLAMQKAAISTALGQEGGYRMETTLAEQHAIKDTVDNVTQGPDKDQRNAEDQSAPGPCSRQVEKVPADQRHGQDTEDTQYEFTVTSPEGHAESHAFIFGKMYQEPVAGNRKLFAKRHMGLHPYLQDLIGQEHNKNS